MKKKSIIALYILMFPFFVFAQQILELPQIDQLPLQSIHRVFQDKEGYIWYGTADGLCRDDGYNIQIFRSDLHTPNVMQNNLILTIAEDIHNRIWYGTDIGVYILDKSDYTIHRLDSEYIKDEKIITINATADGCMWISVASGLYQFLSDETLKTYYPIEKGTGRVGHFYEDKEHNIWICIGGEGLCRLNRETKNIESFSSKTGIPETFIIQDQSQKYYWVGTWGNGIARFDPNASQENRYIYQPATQHKQEGIENLIFYMVQDDVNGYLWLTTNTNILAFSINSQGMLEPVDTSHFLSKGNKMFSEIIKDKDKNLWVAAYDRKSFMINIHDNPIKEYDIPAIRKRLNGNPAIVSLCKDEDNTFWLSQDRWGICLYCPDTEKLVHYTDCMETRNLPLHSIHYLIKSNKKGKIWAMSQDTRVYGIRQINLSMELEEIADLKAITEDSGPLKTIYEDKSGNLWMGTATGLFIYKSNSVLPKTLDNITGMVTGITETNDGVVWVCVNNKGVYRIEENKQTKFFPYDKSFSCIDATSDGKLWLGTFRGEVWLLDPQSPNPYIDYSRICDMNGDVLETVMVDEFNHVWILTNQRVKEFNPENNVYRDYSVPGKTSLLDRFLPLAAYKSPDSRMYFGGIPGFISIKTSNRLKSIPKTVEPIITNIKVGGKSLLFDKHLSLSHNNGVKIMPDSYNIEIHFSTLDYWNTPQIRYAYKLKGVDREWNYAVDGKNRAFYNQLNKGKYTFQVKATDENGLWSDHITEITISKLPVWYETWLAYTFYILLVIGAIGFILYLYLQKIKQENNKKIVKLVSRMKPHYFTNISHDLMTPSTILCAPDEVQSAEKDNPKIEISRLKVSSQDEQLIEKALKTVEENLGDPNFDIPKLAEQLHLTRVTLSRKIKATTGQTALEFVRDIKMRHACRMLENPNITVSEVITALGYNDHGHFTATFKDLFGMTPSEYQKINRNSNL